MHKVQFSPLLILKKLSKEKDIVYSLCNIILYFLVQKQVFHFHNHNNYKLGYNMSSIYLVNVLQ